MGEVGFALMEQRLGAATRRAFANATATLPGGVEVDGCFTRAPAQASNGIGMLSRDVTFACAAADLGEAVQRDTVLTIAGPTAAAASWRVRARLDELETGDAVLTLEALA